MPMKLEASDIRTICEWLHKRDSSVRSETERLRERIDSLETENRKLTNSISKYKDCISQLRHAAKREGYSIHINLDAWREVTKVV